MKLAIALCLLATCFLLNAQTPKGALVENTQPVVQGEQYAIVVGISKYKNLPQLSYADADAQYFADFLINSMGVKKENVRPFLNDAATLAILSELNGLKKKVKAGDRVYIYFSGHGDIETEMEQGGLLLLCESSADNYYLNPNGYIQESQLRAVITQLSNLNAEVIFIADACHSGKLSGGEEGRKNNVLALQQAWSKEVKIFSCQPNELSLEGEQWGKGRGLFSWHLINGLKGAADEPETADQRISLFELQAFLQANVRREAKPNKQTPFAIGNPDMVLCHVTTIAGGQTNGALALNFSANKKGMFSSALTAEQQEIYNRLNTALKSTTGGSTALGYLNQLKEKGAAEEVVEDATRSVVAALLKQSTALINPLLAGNEVATGRTVLESTVADMEKAMALLGTDHYLWPAFESRRLFLKSVGVTLTDEDWKKNVNINQAIQWLEQSVKLEPYAYYSYFRLGECYYMKKLPEKAIEYFNKYKSYLPKDADTYNNIGLAYNKMGNPSQAVKFIGQALSIDSTNYVYYFNMGNIMSQAGDFPRGVFAYRKALQYQPNEPNVLFNMATAFNYAGLNDSSLHYYKVFVAQNATDGRGWQYMGNTQKKMKKYDEALASYTNAIKYGNSAFRLYYNMACIYSIKGDKDKALDLLEESLKRGMFDFVMEMYNDPELANARSVSRFSQLMKKYAGK